MSTIKIKRIYSAPEQADGTRILVDRLWPRGLSKANAHLDLWLKEIAPSTELRQSFHSSDAPDKWERFKANYLKELEQNPAVEELRDIIAKNETVTFLYAVHDEQHNHALILKEVLNG
jgi:uncharacterized protein YeaO (DUF488 family)